MTTKQTFEEWMKIVDSIIARKCDGMTSDDLPDFCYRDMFDDGCLPTQAARRAIAQANE